MHILAYPNLYSSFKMSLKFSPVLLSWLKVLKKKKKSAFWIYHNCSEQFFLCQSI